jgi:hypothetical protein
MPFPSLCSNDMTARQYNAASSPCLPYGKC